MGDPAARKAITLELFAATGESIPEDDPIVTGAILFSHKLNEVARFSAEQMQVAGQQAAAAIDEASQKASLVMNEASQRCAAECAAASAKADAAAQATAKHLNTMAAERMQLVRAIETQVVKAVRFGRQGEAGPVSLKTLKPFQVRAASERRSITHTIRVTVDEDAQIRHAAANRRLDLSSWYRRAVMSRRADVSYEMETVRALRDAVSSIRGFQSAVIATGKLPLMTSFGL